MHGLDYRKPKSKDLKLFILWKICKCPPPSSILLSTLVYSYDMIKTRSYNKVTDSFNYGYSLFTKIFKTLFPSLCKHCQFWLNSMMIDGRGHIFRQNVLQNFADFKRNRPKMELKMNITYYPYLSNICRYRKTSI